MDPMSPPLNVDDVGLAYNGLGVVLTMSRKSPGDFPKCTICRPSELSSLVPEVAQCGGWRLGLETWFPTPLGE
jgi:hypothetical protein